MSFFGFFSGKKGDEKDGSKKDGNNNNNQKSSSLKLQFESEKTGELDNLNNLIKDFKHAKMVFTNYDEYLKIQNFLMSKNNQIQNKFYQNELDFL